MKKSVICILLLLPIFGLGQWKYSKDIDPFDGVRETVIAYGKGGDFPYNNPYFIIRKQNDKVEMYFGDVGSTACGDLELIVSHGDPSDTFTIDVSESTSGDAIFISQYDTYILNRFISLLKNKSKAFFRYRTRCSQNNFEISLNGSKAAIDRIIGGYAKRLLEVSRIKNEIETELMNEKIELQKKLHKKTNQLLDACDDFGLTEQSKISLKEAIDLELGAGKFDFVENIKWDLYSSISMEIPDETTFDLKKRTVELYFNLTDGSKKKIYGDWTVGIDSKTYKKFNEIRERKKEHFENLVSKYKLPKIKTKLKSLIDNKSKENPAFKLEDYDSINIILSDYNKGADKFYDMRVNLYSKTLRTNISIKSFLVSLKITKAESESIGIIDSKAY